MNFTKSASLVFNQARISGRDEQVVVTVHGYCRLLMISNKSVCVRFEGLYIVMFVNIQSIFGRLHTMRFSKSASITLMCDQSGTKVLVNKTRLYGRYEQTLLHSLLL